MKNLFGLTDDSLKLVIDGCSYVFEQVGLLIACLQYVIPLFYHYHIVGCLPRPWTRAYV